MSLNQTPSADRVHIGFFGRRNAGKSSVVNAVTGQELAVVSDIKGTTTDPVQKAMELLPVGPVVIIDTPGIDDEGALGELRVKKTRQVLNRIDVAVLVVDALEGKREADEELLALFREKNIPYLVAYNKKDLLEQKEGAGTPAPGPEPGTAAGTPAPGQEPHTAAGTSAPGQELYVSARTGEQIWELKERIAALAATEESEKRIVADLLSPSDFVVLVVPIDKAAPKGRLILPQQQTIRDILEANAVSVVVKETELKGTLEHLGRKPRLVITDSQVFARVHQETPEDIMLTSFSILFARYKGDLKMLVKGAAAIEGLRDGDTVLISEGCTHHRQCGDIGSVKLPGLLKKYTGKELQIKLTSGTEFPEDLKPYKLIIHCGGCMLNEREMKYRLKCAGDAQVPMTNYGVSMAYMQGILERTLKPFPDIYRQLQEEKEANAGRNGSASKMS